MLTVCTIIEPPVLRAMMTVWMQITYAKNDVTFNSQIFPRLSILYSLVVLENLTEILVHLLWGMVFQIKQTDHLSVAVH